MKSVGGPHAARGPRVGQHWFTASYRIDLFIHLDSLRIDTMSWDIGDQSQMPWSLNLNLDKTNILGLLLLFSISSCPLLS